MSYNPQIHHRNSFRLQGYDYTQPGAYFITSVINHRECILGFIENGETRLSHLGLVVRQAWLDLPQHYPNAVLDEFCVMPNHIHGIILLTDENYGSKPAVPSITKPNPLEAHSHAQRHGIPEIVRGFKTYSARRINQIRRTASVPVWQRNYYEHVIRNELDLDRIRQYIFDNPMKWELDRENPVRP